MAELKFNTPAGNTVARKMLILYMNTGTYELPTWAAIGRRVEDSSMEFDWGEESTTDIFGDIYTKYKPPVITQTFEPCDLDSADEAQLKIWNQAIKDQDTGAMANNDLLVVHAYAGEANTAVFAERYPSSAIRPSGLGGSANVGMPINVTFGGQREKGTASVANGTVTFTKE
jgi:hypothetical protein